MSPGKYPPYCQAYQLSTNKRSSLIELEKTVPLLRGIQLVLDLFKVRWVSLAEICKYECVCVCV